MALVELLGDSLLKTAAGEKCQTADLNKPDLVVGLYFSAHWCPPCRQFTPMLAEFYKKFTAANPGRLEIVFVSSDKSDGDFKSYYGEMPWAALPFSERDLKGKLSSKFKVQGIPTLVFLKADTAELISANGREKVMKDPQGKGFPWPPPTLDSLLLTGQLVSNSGEVDSRTALEGKVRALYFSAKWCGPCKAFTPKLVETYNKLKEDGKEFEIIFVSWDNDEDEFQEYFKNMPWLAVNKEEESRIECLGEHFEVDGIPTLIILDENNKVINERGRAVISNDPEGKEFPWHPKPLTELTPDSADVINQNACLIVLTDKTEAEAEKAKELLQPISTSYVEERKANESLPALSFFYEGPQTGHIINALKDLLGYSEVNGPAVIFVDIREQAKYKRNSASKEDVQEIVDSFKAGQLETSPIQG